MRTVGLSELSTKKSISISSVFSMKQNWSNGFVFHMKADRMQSALLWFCGTEGEFVFENGDTMSVPLGALVYIPQGLRYKVKFIETVNAPTAILLEFCLCDDEGFLTLSDSVEILDPNLRDNQIVDIICELSSQFTMPEIPWMNIKGDVYKLLYLLAYARVHFDNSDNIDLSRPLDFFEKGHTLFTIKSLVDIPKVRANMEEDFGIVPVPKYDTDQTKYVNSCDGGDVACLINTVPDEELENIGIIMEAWSYSSHQSLIPLYKEELIKSRYASDFESYEILDIVFDGAYAAGGLGGINMDTVMRNLVTDYFVPQDTGLASLLQMMSPAVKSSIRQLLNNID